MKNSRLQIFSYGNWKIFTPPPGQTVGGGIMFLSCPSVCSVVCYQTCQHAILTRSSAIAETSRITNDKISDIGRSDKEEVTTESLTAS